MNEHALLDPPAIEEMQFGESRVMEADPSPEDWCFCTCACADSDSKAANAQLTSATMSVGSPQPA